MQETGVVHGAVIGCEEHEIVAPAYFLVEVGEEVGKCLVESEIGVFGLDGVGACLMAYVVGA